MRKIHSGKATFFVANQDTLDALPEQKIKALAEETEALIERNKTLGAEIKAASAGACLFLSPVRNEEGRAAKRIYPVLHYPDRKRTLASHVFSSDSAELARIKSTPTDSELATQIDQVESKVSRSLAPLTAYSRRPHRGLITDRETPRTPRTAARGHASRLNRRARRARHRVGAVARRMGPAEKGVLQVRAPFPF